MANAATASDSGGTEYVWEAPGSPVRVHLSTVVVQQLWQHLLSASNADLSHCKETGGLLVGTLLEGALYITGVHLLAGDGHSRYFILSEAEINAIGHAAQQRKSNIVGYFRTDLRGGIRISDEEAVWIHRSFPDPKFLTLVVGIENGVRTAGFFFQKRGAFVQFPFDTRMLSSTLPKAAPKLAGSSAMTAGVAPDRAPGFSHSRKLLYTIGLIAVTVGMASYAAFRFYADPPAQIVSASAERLVISSPLSLSTEDDSDGIAITWDSKVHPFRDARIAVFSIKDGPSQREVALTKAEIQTNRLRYTPKSRRFEVTLETFDGSGKSIRDSVMFSIPETSMRSRARVEPTTARPAAIPTVPVATLRKFAPPPKSPVRINRTESVLVDAPPPVDLTSRALSAPAVTVDHTIRTSAPTVIPRLQVAGTPDSAPAVLPPVASRQINPVVPPHVKAMIRTTTTVGVRVRIDERGRVTAAELVTPASGLASYLGHSALQAARGWSFHPARRNGVGIASESILKFSFAPSRR